MGLNHLAVILLEAHRLFQIATGLGALLLPATTYFLLAISNYPIISMQPNKLYFPNSFSEAVTHSHYLFGLNDTICTLFFTPSHWIENLYATQCI